MVRNSSLPTVQGRPMSNVDFQHSNLEPRLVTVLESVTAQAEVEVQFPPHRDSHDSDAGQSPAVGGCLFESSTNMSTLQRTSQRTDRCTGQSSSGDLNYL